MTLQIAHFEIHQQAEKR